MRKIACITGSRADYGYLRPVMKRIEEDKELELIPIVTGMHHLEKFGHTVDEVKKDFHDIVEVPLELLDDTGFGTAIYVSMGIKKIAESLERISPDFCLVMGDRTETFSAVQAAVYQNIPITHMHGGDILASGLDEPIRHSITRFAHIHLPATKKSAERIIKMGEEPWRVHIVGSPTLDEMLSTEIPKKEDLLRRYNLNKPYILIVQHPITSQFIEAESQMRITLDSILEVGMQSYIIYPNSDQGGQKMIEVIEGYLKRRSIKGSKSVSREDYLGLLKYSSVLVGNSSSGMIESSSFKIPVVNIGIRQNNRERANNVLDVNHDKKEIIDAIMYALNNSEFRRRLDNCRNPYGDGHTSERICRILKETEVNGRLLQKGITY